MLYEGFPNTTNDLRAMPGSAGVCEVQIGKTHSFYLGKARENTEQAIE